GRGSSRPFRPSPSARARPDWPEHTSRLRVSLDMAGEETDEPPRRLDQIETDWARVNEPRLFVLRYAAAVRAYLTAVLRDAADVDEVAQQFMLRVVRTGFRTASPSAGRFRDYLKAALRNAARTHHRRESARSRAAAPVRAAAPDADRAWLDEWRRCLL